MQVLRYGYQVPFCSRPPLSRVPLPLPSYGPDAIRGLALAAAVVALQEEKAIELAPPSPGYNNRLFVTPKVTGGWRPVIDLLRLNSWVDVSHFHMETTQSVLQSLHLRERLDGIPGSPGSGPSVFATLPEVLRGRVSFPVSHPLLRPVDGSVGVYTRHGPSLFDHASSRFPHAPVPRRLACSGLLLSRDRAGKGFSSLALSTSGDSDQHSQELSDTDSITRLFRDDNSDYSFEGFPDPRVDSLVGFSPSDLSLQQPPSSVCLATTSGSDVIHVRSRSGFEAALVVSSASHECHGFSSVGRHLGLLGRLLPAGSSVVV